MKLSNLFVLVIIALFLLSAQVTFAQEPTDTPDDESGSAALGENSPVGEAVTPTDDEPAPTEEPEPEPIPVDPYENAWENLGLFAVALLGAAKAIQVTIEKLVKPALDNTPLRGKAWGKWNWGNWAYFSIIHGAALSIGVITALAGKGDLFSNLPYAFFQQWEPTTLYIVSGVAAALMATKVHDFGKAIAAVWSSLVSARFNPLG